MDTDQNNFQSAQFIKEIGRGKENPRDLSRSDACALWNAVLDGRVSDLELGAILIAMRIKGESCDEVAGFLEASEQHTLKLAVPPTSFAPVVIPSYNGARNMPNLTPLLAMLLAREGVPVLVHGKVSDRDAAPIPSAPPMRVTTAEVFHVMGLPAARNADEASVQLARGGPVFMPIQILNPALARMLALRRVLGVRNSSHTLVKLLQPFEGPALRLASYTHPEYQRMLSTHLLAATAENFDHVLLSRGTEGEAVANARRAAQIDWFHDGVTSTIVPGQSGVVSELPILPESRDAVITAMWIQAVVSGERPVPEAIAQQVQAILTVLRGMRAAAGRRICREVA